MCFRAVETKRFQHRVKLMSTCTALPCAALSLVRHVSQAVGECKLRKNKVQFESTFTSFSRSNFETGCFQRVLSKSQGHQACTAPPHQAFVQTPRQAFDFVYAHELPPFVGRLSCAFGVCTYVSKNFVKVTSSSNSCWKDVTNTKDWRSGNPKLRKTMPPVRNRS